MEGFTLPVDRHYMIFTKLGFCTINARPENIDNELKLVINDVPFRFVSNLCYADSSNKKLVDQISYYFDNTFYYACLKYFGVPALTGLKTKEVIKKYECPIIDIMDKLDGKAFPVFIDSIIKTDPEAFDGIQDIQVKESPLYIFTRNGLPDFE